MAISYLTMLEKVDNTTRYPASEHNAIKDALTDGTKSITTQGVLIKSASYSSSGALNIGGFAAMDSSGGALAMTLAAPTEAGIHQIISLVTAGNDAVVTLGSGVTCDGTNNTLTFNAAAETLILISISTTRWAIIQNVGSVALSTV